MTIDKRRIKQPYIPYEEIDGGFRISTEGGKTNIEFEKAGGFTKETFRGIIIERYKNNPIMKVYRNCTRECKQVSVKGSNMKFTCAIRIKKLNRRKK